MLRGAIIGLGNVAVGVHVPAWARRREVDIVALSDTDPTRRTLVDALLPGAGWYDSPQELLARERLDFVDICTPPATHGPLVCQGADRGLPPFRQQPLVLLPQGLG